MQPDGQYLLETHWAWDHAHTDYFTLTLGDSSIGPNPAPDLDPVVLFQPNGPNNHNVGVLMRLIQRICAEQNGNPMAQDCRPIAIYRVKKVEKAENSKLTFDLEIIGKFDLTGQPIRS